jgi:outer membrane protein OmpA-like peptidoglycan-associated protein
MKRSQIVSALLVGAAAMSVQAKTVWVPDQSPTINGALSQVDYGDSVRVRPGIYNENIEMIQGVVLAGENPYTTIIDGGRKGPTVLGASQAVITGFTIRNGISGILCENTQPEIVRNIILDNHGSGIDAHISQPKIRNNVILGNRWSGIQLFGVNGKDMWVENNVILDNGYSGISLMGPTRVRVRNNIIIKNNEYGIFTDDEATAVAVRHNNIWRNYYPFNSRTKVDKTNLSVNPIFKNGSVFVMDYYPAPKSQMLGKGEGGTDIGLMDREVQIAEGSTDAGVADDIAKPIAKVETKTVVATGSVVTEAPSDLKISVEFSLGSADIKQGSLSSLDGIAAKLKDFKTASYEVKCVEKGKNSKKLAQSRADAVVKALVAKGVESKLTAVGDIENGSPDKKPFRTISITRKN